MAKKVDIIDVMVAIKNGKLKAFIHNGFFLLEDTMSGERVNLNEVTVRSVRTGFGLGGCVMADREKLIELLRSDMNVLKAAGTSATATLRLADNLIANGVTFAKNTNVLTKADRIRAMSDEELAVFLKDVEYDVEQYPFVQDWDKWLKQPAEGE